MAAGQDSIAAIIEDLQATHIRDDEDTFKSVDDLGDEVILCSDFDRHGSRLATGSGDHKIRVLEHDKSSINDESKTFRPVDCFRGHDGYVNCVKWHPVKSRPGMIASTGLDLRLRIWLENLAEASNTGRRFRCIHSQSSALSSMYESISWACPPCITSNTNTYNTVLAAVTRSGLLSIIEPVETAPGGKTPNDATASGNRAVPHEEWIEQDHMWIMGSAVARAVETSFVVDFYAGDIAGVGYGPNYAAIEAGVDERALTLAVTAMDEIRVYRVLGEGPDGDSRYSFGHPVRPPVAELTGAPGVLVRHIKWAPHAWKPRDRLASAWQDNKIRIYEIWTPEESDQSGASTIRNAGSNVEARARAKVPSGIGAGLAGAANRSSDRRFGANHVLHRWELVAELEHEGVGVVDWMREGTTLVSLGDDGQSKLWQEDANGHWAEFAHIGDEDEDFVASE